MSGGQKEWAEDRCVGQVSVDSGHGHGPASTDAVTVAGAQQPTLESTASQRRCEHLRFREVSGYLVGSAAFKAVGTGDPRPAGSIPVHLRCEIHGHGALLRRDPAPWSRISHEHLG